MPEYRRHRQPGGTFFFMLVTAGRRSILTTDRARPLLRRCIADARRRRPFEMVGFVLLPDHLHTIRTLPAADTDYSTRWRHIKGAFTHAWLDEGGGERWVRPGQDCEGRRGVWQPRFMEHTIRDEDDLNHHLECIHYNPVRHGLVDSPKDWPWSSFHRHVKLGHYAPDWCCGSEDPRRVLDGDYLE